MRQIWPLLFWFLGVSGMAAEKPEAAIEKKAVVAEPAPSLKLTAFDKDKNEQIVKTATLGSYSLTRVGSCIRAKRVFVVNVDVYRATLLASEINKFVRKTDGTLALDSLVRMPAFALVLDFKRSVDAEDIVKSFEAALKENNVADSALMNQFKAAVKEGGKVENGSSVSISVVKNTLIAAFGKKSVEIKGDENFIKQVFSIWFGKPADGGLKTMRDKIIMGS